MLKQTINAIVVMNLNHKEKISSLNHEKLNVNINKGSN